MGKTSKPLTIHIDKTLYEASEVGWLALREQGHDIVVCEGGLPDLYMAPYAMRMTPTMMAQLPSSIELAIKGARALRYGPTAKDTEAWKGAKKSAKGKGTHKRKHVTKQVEAVGTGEPPTTAEDTGTGGGTVSTASETTNIEGNS